MRWAALPRVYFGIAGDQPRARADQDRVGVTAAWRTAKKMDIGADYRVGRSLILSMPMSSWFQRARCIFQRHARHCFRLIADF